MKGIEKYKELKSIYTMFLEDCNTSELRVLLELVNWVEDNFPSNEEILLDVNNQNSGDIAIENGQAMGLEIMRNIHIKIKSYKKVCPDLFDSLGFIHATLVNTLRMYMKTNSIVAKPYISKVTNDVMILFTIKNLNSFFATTIKKILDSKSE